MLAATVAQVVLVLDLVAGILGRGNWLQWAALLLGLVELAIARALDGDPDRRPWAFWKHVAAALLIGTAIVTLLDSWGVGWVLIGLLALGFIALARAFERSVWAVVGAFGLVLVTTHFVDEPDTVVADTPDRAGAGQRRRARGLAGVADLRRPRRRMSCCSASCCASRRCTTTEPPRAASTIPA